MKSGMILAISVVCAAVSFTGAEGAVLPKTSQLVPPETIVLVDIGDFNQLRTKFEKGFIYKFYKDPAMAAFVGDFTGKIKEKLAGGGDSIVGLKGVFDANGLPEGRMAIAIVLTGEEKEPAILLISQWGPNIARIKEAVEKTAGGAIEQGAGRSAEDYCDVNLVTLTRAEKTCYCFIDDCLIAGTDVDTVKFVVARIKGVGGSPGLAGDPDYVAAMGAVGPYHDVDLYVNVKQMLRRMAAGDKTGEDQMMLSNLGLDNVAGLGCSLSFGGDTGGTLCGKAFLKTAGTRKGVLKMLETSLGPVRPPRFVPASAYSVSILNVDVKRAYDELVGIIYGFNPAEAMSLQKPLVEPGAEGETAIFLRPDIIEYLGSQIVIAQNINKPFVAGAMPTENLIAIEVGNRGALERSLSLVHRRLIVPNNPEPTRELLGHTIYLLGPIGVPFFGGAAPLEFTGGQASPRYPRMAFTITDTHLILGQEPAVERAVRTLAGAESEPVASAKWFTAAKSAVPSVVGLAGFEDNSASGELLWWMLKEGSKAWRASAASVGMGPTGVVMARPDLWQFGDFGLLPEFDAVRKYFGYSAFYGVTRPDGFLFELKYLEPR